MIWLKYLWRRLRGDCPYCGSWRMVQMDAEGRIYCPTCMADGIPYGPRRLLRYKALGEATG